MQATVNYREQDGELMARLIDQFFFELIYAPLMRVLANEPAARFKLNAPEDDLIKKIRSGAIIYDGSYFVGKFDAKSGRIIREMGGKWDAKKKAFRLDHGKLSDNVKSAVSSSSERLKRIHEGMVQELEKAQDRVVEQVEAMDLTAGLDRVVAGLQGQTVKAMKAVGVQYSLTHGQKEALKKDYTQNIKLYIKDFAQEHIEKLRGEVEKNAMSGYRAKELEERLRVKYGASRSKAKFLAKQETSLFMSKFRRERFLDAGVEFYRWDSLGDRRVRLDHRKLNGRIFKFGDPPVSDSSTGKRAEPGEDFNCLPGYSKVEFAYGIEKCFRRWYCGELTELVTASGKTVRATPNHPVLTKMGWKPIGMINEFDEVVELCDYLINASETYKNNRITTIQEIFNSGRKPGLSKTFEGKRDQFHGDGSNGNVDVVDAAGALRINRKAKRKESIGKFFLSLSDLFTSCLSNKLKGFAAFLLWYATSRFVRGGSKFLSLLKSKFAHANAVSLRSVANNNSRLKQAGADNTTIKTCSLRDGKLALAGEVSLDNRFWVNFQPIMGASLSRVIKVRRLFYNGHVYNLQTKLGYYTSAGVVVSNCRCRAVALVGKFHKVGGEWKRVD